MADIERDAAYWIAALDLHEHPEGGYFRETYRSDEAIDSACLPERFGGRRSLCTSIYFLLKGNQRSLFHRLRSDEVWHFHAGSSATLYIIDTDGRLIQRRVGCDIENGESPQAVIPANCWFGAMVNDPDGFTLVGCTVSPGFEFDDFQMASRADLLELYPDHRTIIEQLTTPND